MTRVHRVWVGYRRRCLRRPCRHREGAGEERILLPPPLPRFQRCRLAWVGGEEGEKRTHQNENSLRHHSRKGEEGGRQVLI